MSDGKDCLNRVLLGLQNEQLSTIPSILFQILQISSDPQASAADLGAIFGKDQSSAARLLKTANSVLHSTLTRTHVDTIEEAIVRIGFKAAREVAVSAIICDLFKSSRTIHEYSLPRLWQHSMCVGMGARLLYSSLSVNRSYDPYLAGLLHDIGIVLEHQFLFEDGFRDAVAAQYQSGTSLIEQERLFLGTTHDVIGAEVGRRWGFADHIVTAIRHHHDLEVQNEEYRTLTHAVRVSEALCAELDYGYSDFDRSQEEAYRASREALGLDDQIAGMVKAQLEIEYMHMEQIDWFRVA
ncbi:MAG: HDOD domain-containing protein [Kiritimatiellae bacterium]|nr:HDOD domain-containing protein [Kiritimatiellia bacterium]